MSRYHVRIEGYYETEIDAESEDEALSVAMRQAEDVDGWVGTSSEATELRYEPPAGTERYHEVAGRIRFSDTFPPHRWLSGLGSWWWTDGHAMLRCDGPEPSDQTHRLTNDVSMIAALDEPRAVAGWGPLGDFFGVPIHRDVGDPRIVINADLRALVECGWPDVEWHVSDGQCDVPASVPMLAYSGGELVAVVMGILDNGAA